MNKVTRLVFIDDSGDPGFSFDKGSSRFLVLVAVMFNNVEESKIAHLFIKDLKTSFNLKSDLEFKFNKLNKKDRKRFLTKVRKLDFLLDCLVVDKTITNIKDSLYAKAIGSLLLQSKDLISGSKVKIDGKLNHKLKNELVKYIGKNTRLSFTKSDDNLIQLADMLAGSIRRSYESSKSDRDYYISFIKKKIRNIWML